MIIVEAGMDTGTLKWSDCRAWKVGADGRAYADCADGEVLTTERADDAIAWNTDEETQGDDPFVRVSANEGQRYLDALLFQNMLRPTTFHAIYIAPDDWVMRENYEDFSGIPQENVVGTPEYKAMHPFEYEEEEEEAT